MSSTFTPSNAIDMTKEKEWAANIGMLDWDSTSIVFTKRSLIEFLKYTGTTVDTNFNNISRLPRYAKFGKLTGLSETDDIEGSKPEIAPTDSVSGNSADFKPSRRVRTVPGGPTHDIFGHDEGDDALSMAPPKSKEPILQDSMAHVNEAVVAKVPVKEIENVVPSDFKPSRRVRTQPGGQSSLSNFWGTEEHADNYKPTRRVREGPGGQDHMNDIL